MRRLQSSWEADRALLSANGYDVTVLRERVTFVEARVSSGNDRVLVEWARDSAFRFFPLMEHTDLGLVLHPFDLATNKVLALVGRLEPRDWIDVLECDARLQPLGYLAWAACWTSMAISYGTRLRTSGVRLPEGVFAFMRDRSEAHGRGCCR